MQILIDADGCPVVDLTISIAREHQLECLIFCDTSHVFEKAGAKTLTFSKGADSVDFALVNRVQRNDLVITQDYGLAAMCLSRTHGSSIRMVWSTPRTTLTHFFWPGIRPRKSAMPAVI